MRLVQGSRPNLFRNVWFKVDPHMDLIVANLLCGELRYVPGISPSSVPMGLYRPIGTIVQLLPDSDVLHVKVCCL